MQHASDAACVGLLQSKPLVVLTPCDTPLEALPKPWPKTGPAGAGSEGGVTGKLKFSLSPSPKELCALPGVPGGWLQQGQSTSAQG